MKVEGSADWRRQVKLNKQRSLMVIFAFFLLYIFVGLVIEWIFLRPPGMSTYDFVFQVLYSPRETLFIMPMIFLAFASYISGRFFSKAMMLNGMNYSLVGPDASDHAHKQLYNIVEEMKIAASLNYMPKVYIANVPILNAFATGWNEKNAAIVVTQPLIDILTREELQAVVAHELIHIRNHDIRLISSVFVMSSLILFIIDVLFRSMIYSSPNSRREKNAPLMILAVLFILRLVLPIITMALCMFLSRSRELMADAGAVQITRQNEPLANALLKIHQQHKSHPELQETYSQTPNETLRRSSYLYDQRAAGFKNYLDLSQWFSSHPPMKDRLAAMGVTYTEKS